MSDAQVEEWRGKCRELVASRVNGEEVIAAAGFRQGGASANFMASKAQLGGIVYAGIKLARKKKAGGLPDKVMLAVTPKRVYAFNLKIGRDYKLGDEVAVWERAGLRASTQQGTMTALTIESPAEGEKVTLVGISIKDDPVSQDLMEVLQGSPSQPG